MSYATKFRSISQIAKDILDSPIPPYHNMSLNNFADYWPIVLKWIGIPLEHEFVASTNHFYATLYEIALHPERLNPREGNYIANLIRDFDDTSTKIHELAAQVRAVNHPNSAKLAEQFEFFSQKVYEMSQALQELQPQRVRA